MKAEMLLDGQSAAVLGLAWLVEAVAPLSPYGARRFSRIVPFRPGDEQAAESRARRITTTATRLSADRVGAFRSTLAGVADVSGAIARASLGEVLDDPDLLEVRRFCETLERLELANDATRTIEKALAIARTPSAEFYLADALDAELAPARQALAQAQAELDASRGREAARVARELGRDEIAGDEFIVMRADLHEALPAGVRVLREAPTYLLCSIECGEIVLATLARREAAFGALAVVEERVRERLSSSIAEFAGELAAAADALGEFDVILAGVRFAQRYGCVAPAVVETPVVSFERGRFLPLETELVGAGRSYVPIDLDLSGVAVLTGPNMGGKSATLQTCGFLALLVAFGLPVPAAAARVGLFDEIAWLGLGLEERTGGLLSSFAQELLALKSILDRAAPRLLLLADEFARTTTPHEAKALVVALLEDLSERNACALMATHLQGIAAAAGVRHFAVRGLRAIPRLPERGDLSEALAQLAALMDYRIVEVAEDEIPRADAIALAELLGVDRALVEAAYRALSQ